MIYILHYLVLIELKNENLLLLLIIKYFLSQKLNNYSYKNNLPLQKHSIKGKNRTKIFFIIDKIIAFFDKFKSFIGKRIIFYEDSRKDRKRDGG